MPLQDKTNRTSITSRMIANKCVVKRAKKHEVSAYLTCRAAVNAGPAAERHEAPRLTRANEFNDDVWPEFGLVEHVRGRSRSRIALARSTMVFDHPRLPQSGRRRSVWPPGSRRLALAADPTRIA